MFQFSLRNLLIAVAAVALGTAGLLNANSWWASLLWSAALLMLMFAGLVAFIRSGAQRTFWGGYAATGSLYLLLLMYSMPQVSSSNTWMPYGPLYHDNLATTKVIFWAYSLLPTSKTTPALTTPTPPVGMGGLGGGGGMAGMTGGGFPGGMGGGQFFRMAPPNPNYIELEVFTQVGQALWMFFLSWLGGTVAFLLFRSRERSSVAPT